MLPEVLDTGLFACAMPLAASVLLFGIYSVIRTESALERSARAAFVSDQSATADAQ
ncbi:hypothetical protein [Labrenzia sp. PHM005]|uniref:hypothetical protein n=1 Tax=Labrenzia sp. PHM005 TaxID=2590016 RepID=UPI00143D1BBC|nr:hypothetical protein [Labrenzia sp. PHM005]